MHLRTRFLSCILLAATISAQQWDRFRGPSQGIAIGDQALPVEFGPEKNLIWKCALPPGHSSPVIWEDRIFVTAHTDSQLLTICIDRHKGEIQWRQEIEVQKLERAHRLNSSAAPTPTLDGERVFAYFGSFGLICYDFSGEEVWRRELTKPNNTFGTAASPVLANGRLILNRDTNKASFLEAIDPENGETIWKVDRSGFKSGWSTPVTWRNGDVDELLVYGAYRLTAFDLIDGSERWSMPGLTDEPCITPVTGEGLVFLTSYNMRTNPEVIGLPKFAQLLEQYDTDRNGRLNREEVRPNKSILSRIDADGEGDHPLRGFFRFIDMDRDGEITAKEWPKMSRWLETMEFVNAIIAIRPGDGDKRDTEIVWQHAHGVPEIPSPLYYDGRIFTVKNGGIASSLDAKTGKLAYQKRIGSRGPCYASPVLGDGKIYTASARGTITVLKAGSEFAVLAHNEMKERIMATPAIANGRIYVRTENALYVFGKAD